MAILRGEQGAVELDAAGTLGESSNIAGTRS